MSEPAWLAGWPAGRPLGTRRPNWADRVEAKEHLRAGELSPLICLIENCCSPRGLAFWKAEPKLAAAASPGARETRGPEGSLRGGTPGGEGSSDAAARNQICSLCDALLGRSQKTTTTTTTRVPPCCWLIKTMASLCSREPSRGSKRELEAQTSRSFVIAFVIIHRTHLASRKSRLEQLEGVSRGAVWSPGGLWRQKT